MPEGLENVFTLSIVLLIVQSSNALVHESGIMSVAVAGMVVGNIRSQALGELKEFKEQLTVMLIGLLFVLLAADVRLDDVLSLGWPGVWTVVVLMVVVRPINVLIGTAGADLAAREKLFLSWLAPRGIVAAAVASLCAQTLNDAGIAGGRELRALVFLVIGVTVLVQGLSGGPLARLLGLQRNPESGYAILGASLLGQSLARILEAGGEEVVLIDSDPDACRSAAEAGFRVLHGSGLGESLLSRAELDTRAGSVGVTTNDELNLLFARRARKEYKVPRAWVALRRGHLSVTPEMVREIGARVLFGEPRRADLWTLRLERGLALVERWRLEDAERGEAPPSGLEPAALPLAVERAARVRLVDEETRFRQGDELYLAVFKEQRDEVEAGLLDAGWVRSADAEHAAGGRSDERDTHPAPGATGGQ